MAIKADRRIVDTEIRFYCNQLAVKGQVMSLNTSTYVPSGVAMDSTYSSVGTPSSSSGAKPVGLIFEDVVNLDLTRFPINWHRDQANSGDKVCLLTKGWVTTDQVQGTVNAGDWAVLSSSGLVGSATRGAPGNDVANPRVGKWVTGKDQNGFATLYIDL